MKKFLSLIILTLSLNFVSAGTISTPADVAKQGFVKNNGQVIDEKGNIRNDVLFTYQGKNEKLFFFKDKIVYAIYRFEHKETPESIKKIHEGNLAEAEMLSLRIRQQRIDFEFINSNPNVEVSFENKLKNYNNYFIGRNIKLTNVPIYSQIRYKNVFNNVDIIFKTSENGFKYDIILKPGAKLSDVKFKYNGSDNISLNDNSLIIKNLLNTIKENIPKSYYQETNENADINFSLQNDNSFGFKFNNSDDDIINNTLIIDPSLTWSTYYENTTSGSVSIIRGNDIVDEDGNFFYQVNTYTADLPLANPGGTVYFDPSYNPSSGLDIYFAKFDVNRNLVWATYLGGTEGNQQNYYDHALATYDGHFYICGKTTSDDFPMHNMGGGAYYVSTQPASTCGFLSRFNISTGAMEHSTYLRAYQEHHIAVDNNGNVAEVSFNYTSAPLASDVMSRSGAYNQSTHGGDSDIFIYMFNSNLVQTWGTYFGGAGYSEPMGLVFDHNNNLFMFSRASSTTAMIYANPGGGAYYDNTFQDKYDLGISKFNTSGALVWSTLYGGSGLEGLSYSNIDVNENDDVIITTTTRSTDITTHDQGGAAYYDGTAPTGVNNGWGGDPGTGFYARFNNNGVLQHATYLGVDNESNYIQDQAQGNCGRQYLILQTKAFPTTSLSGSYNVSNADPSNYNYMAIQFDSDFSIRWASYLQTQNDYFTRFAIDNNNGRLYATGTTKSNLSYNLANPGSGAYYDGTFSSGTGYALAIMELNIGAPPTVSSIGSANVCEGDDVTLNASGSGTINWYNAPTGGTLLHTGATYTINNISSTTTVYVESVEDGCASSRTAYTVTVNPLPTISVSASSNPICQGQSTTISASGASSYSWSDGLGSGSSKLVSPSSSHTYYVTGTDGNSCSNSGNILITVNPLPGSAGSISGSTTLCPGETATYTVPAIANATSYVWTLPSGFTGSSTSNSITVTAGTTSGTISVYGTNSCGNGTSSSLSITVNTNSTAASSVSASTNPVCEGSSTDLTLSGGTLGTGATWTWYEGGCGNGSPVGTGTSITINPTTSTTYYVRAEGTCNTTSCASVAITVTPAANAGTNGSISLCENDASIDLFSQLGGTPSGGGTWTNSLGNTVSNIFDPSTMSSDVFTYTVTGTAPCGDASATVTVTVNPLPNVSFSGLDSVYCGTGTTILTGNQAPNGTFSGIGITDNGNGTAEYNYSAPGTYNIIYSYTNSNSCTDVDTQVVTIYSMPNVAFVGLDTAYCEGNSIINIIGNQAPNGTFSGPGITDNGNGSATYSPTTVGLQTITYQYTDANSCTAVDSQIVEVFDSPNIDTLIVTDATCNGNDGIITSQVSGGNGTYNYLWSNNDTTPTIDSLSSGTYTLTLSDGNNCQSQASATIQNSASNISINITDITNVDCNGNSTGSITVDASGASSYLWSNGDTTNVADSLSAGTYYITVQDSLGCQGVDTIVIQEPSALIYNDSIVNISCYGLNNGKIYLYVSGGTSPYSYSWQGGNGFTSTNEYLTDLTPGEYTVTVTDDNGCTFNLDKISVIQPDTALYTIINSNPPACYGNTDGTAISVANGGTPPYIYNWSNGDMTSSTSNLAGGTYYLTVTDANFCTNIDTVYLISPTKIDISEQITNASCIGNNDGQITLNITGGTSPYNLQWNTTPVQTDTVATNLTAGTYSVTVTDFNKCSQVYSYDIADGNDICLEIPTAITPNQDGVNDNWELKGIWIYPDIHIEIYNRWGDLIFSFDGSGSEYDANRWDGTYNGKELPISSYVFILDLKDGNTPIQGVVTIVK